MNERIRALAEQASFSGGHIVAEVIAPDYSGPELHLLVDAFNSLPREIRDHISQSLIKNQQKFAELIVRECIDCLAPLSRNHSIVGAAQDTIKEHFGVK